MMEQLVLRSEYVDAECQVSYIEYRSLMFVEKETQVSQMNSLLNILFNSRCSKNQNSIKAQRCSRSWLLPLFSYLLFPVSQYLSVYSVLVLSGSSRRNHPSDEEFVSDSADILSSYICCALLCRRNPLHHLQYFAGGCTYEWPYSCDHIYSRLWFLDTCCEYFAGLVCGCVYCVGSGDEQGLGFRKGWNWQG